MEKKKLTFLNLNAKYHKNLLIQFCCCTSLMYLFIKKKKINNKKLKIINRTKVIPFVEPSWDTCTSQLQ
jgi:hypothetical protein